MSILMTPNNMQDEIMRRGDLKQTDIKEDSVKISNSANPDSAAKISRFNPVGNSSDTKKATQPNRIDTRPAFDQYTPEKPDGQKSYGHYKMVADEYGNPKAQFFEPSKNLEEKENDTSMTDVSGKSDTEKSSEGSQKLQKLKKKRQELKQQILSEADPKKAEQLKKKLALIERKIKSQQK
ncbi:hypothetical protein EBB54_12560 [Schaedlerella arabinosiphila]|jgi:hypothetical protein|uniref:Uncharacterized protein n=1 Tax=Schaedlerella arabinosiphila TaxID=2044587 RepID=A0A3R8KUI5_9FIRM|nr:hypothetical protein [Schaedlerella arabinosiphila]EOS40228.1 hypothetical protein C808_01199 [Lachnospiraceae bacterium M18-1]RRK32110.1 hypothetical protein EBB54_12560 [Schaedlerella arabinosiphila]